MGMSFKYIVAGAIGLVYESRAVLSKALLVPFALYMLLDAISALKLAVPVTYAVFILNVAVQTVFAITTHRVLLLGPGSVPKWGLYKLSKRELYFVAHLLGLGLILLPLGLLTFIPFVGGILAIVLYCWLVGRLSLVFPAIAIDQGVSFKYSWELTKNYQLLMFLVVIIYPILLAIPALFIGLVSNMSYIVSFLSTLATVFVVAALSVSYKLIYAEAYES